MAAAARGSSPRSGPPELELTARRATPEVSPEAKRPLPYPEPIGINDNSDELVAPTARATRRRPGLLQLLARIVIAPLYVVTAAGTLGILALFARGLLGY